MIDDNSVLVLQAWNPREAIITFAKDPDPREPRHRSNHLQIDQLRQFNDSLPDEETMRRLFPIRKEGCERKDLRSLRRHVMSASVQQMSKSALQPRNMKPENRHVTAIRDWNPRELVHRTTRVQCSRDLRKGAFISRLL